MLKNPIFRALVQIVGCALGGPVACGALSGVITLASGGSVVEALTAMALSWAQIGVSSLISDAMHVIQATYGLVGEAIHAGVHGVIGGAVAIAQGGSFLQGFVSNSIGVIGGSISGFSIRGMDVASTLGRTLIAAAAGCASAVATGSKCGQAAVTAAISHLFNQEAAATRFAASATARMLPVAATVAAIDGPLPVGDAVGALGLIVTGVYDLILLPVGVFHNEGSDGDESDAAPTIDEAKQGKHVPGHKNFVPGRSVLTHENPQGLLDQASGKGHQIGQTSVPLPGSKERYDWGETIGIDGHSGGPTTVGIIHYGQRGAHIVPVRPKR